MKNKSKIYREKHLEECRAYDREWKKEQRKNHPEIQREINKRSVTKRRKRFLEMYGNKCAICGETEYMFLTIDHVQNDGNIDNFDYGGKGSLKVLQEAISEYNPNKFQTLCWNCNYNKAIELMKSKAKSTNPKTIATIKHNRKIKETFFKMYGGKCNCPMCSEERTNYLSLDHINNDGCIMKQHKRGSGSMKEYENAVKEYRPDVYQILCYNCNSGKGRNSGVCPHIKNKEV